MLLSHGERGGVGDEPDEPTRAEQGRGEGRVSDVAQGVRATDNIFGDGARVGGGSASLASKGRIPGDGVQEGAGDDVFAEALYGEFESFDAWFFPSLFSFVRFIRFHTMAILTRVMSFSSRIPQAYQARLRIDHTIHIHPVKSYPGDATPKMRMALHICKIAFDAFFEDTKCLVAVGVRADIARRTATASSAEDLARTTSRGKLREERLRSWLKCRFPLTYGVEQKESAYELLLEAVSPDEQAVMRGLLNWKEFCMGHRELATTLSEMSRPQRPTAAKAPVVRNGSFLPVLKIVHQSLLDMSKKNLSEEAQQHTIRFLFKKSLKVFQVQYFPAAKVRSGTVGAGAPNLKPVFDSWGNLGKRERAGSKSGKGGGSRGARETVAVATVALKNVIAEDCNAEWTAKDLDLRTLRTVVRKTTLPTNFRVPSLANEKYVDETYEWVRENYDGTKKVHHLALLIGIVVASTLVPDLFMATRMKKKFLDAKTEDMVREVYDEMKWEGKTGKTGMSDWGIFVGMFTMFIIALYEEESPLRKHMGGSQR